MDLNGLKYGDKIKIVEGFYKGMEGVLRCPYEDGYIVDLGGCVQLFKTEDFLLVKEKKK